MCFQLKLIRKEIYLSFLLSILLFASIDIFLYNYIVLGKEENDNNDIDEVREEEEDIEDISINELFDNDNNDNNRDKRDKVIEKEDRENDVPFILPFNAVPFP
jgi:hypothetical protein